MSYLNFERAADKDRAREELREARAELLKKAEYNAKLREDRDKKSKLRGDVQWMLPSLSKKIDKMSEALSSTSKTKKSKKEKKKKSKKEKHKKNRNNSSSDSDSSEEEKIIKRKRKTQKSSESQSSSDSDNDNEDCWIEKEIPKKPVERDDWMSGSSLCTYTKEKPDKKKDEHRSLDSYNPGQNSRELNPYWKNGGTGLPTFQKPTDDDDNDNNKSKQSYNKFSTSRRGNWRKKDLIVKQDEGRRSSSRERRRYKSRSPEVKKYERRSRESSPREKRISRSYSKSPEVKTNERRYRKSSSREGRKNSITSKSPEINTHERIIKSSSRESQDQEEEKVSKLETTEILQNSNDFLTDQQMNELGAKLIKAEIMGNNELREELKDKLDRARIFRNSYMEGKSSGGNNMNVQNREVDHVILTKTGKGGISRPLETREQWGGRREAKKKGKKAETHIDSERIRFFADDDKYDIKQMFEREKFTTGNDADAEFVKIASKHKNPNDDIEDIFTDKARKIIPDSKIEEKERNEAIREHQNITRTLENCDKCFDSVKMEKQLIVAMGKNVYLCLPSHEGLQPGHCLIVPMQHNACSTQLDEDVWTEINEFRKALTLMFQSKSQDVVFFETARYLHKKPHMVIHCVPSKEFELLPFYFKKAIQESEREWSTNKQLIELKNEKKDLRRMIPKGLPYFWVNFGMDYGFAHVVEEQERFPSNFAQETIGGLLNLDSRLWRRPRKDYNPIPKVKQFADLWKKFDITEN